LIPKFSIGIFELLNLIYEEHFKYKQRFPTEIVIPKIPRTKGLFWVSFFGDIPDYILGVINEHYSEVLDIKGAEVETTGMKELLDSNVLFPRRITQYGLNTLNRSGFRRSWHASWYEELKKRRSRRLHKQIPEK
jgi:hypothetical protein